MPTEIFSLHLVGPLVGFFAFFEPDTLRSLEYFFTSADGLVLQPLTTSNAMVTRLLEQAELIARNLGTIEDRRSNLLFALIARRVDSTWKLVPNFFSRLSQSSSWIFSLTIYTVSTYVLWTSLDTLDSDFPTPSFETYKKAVFSSTSTENFACITITESRSSILSGNIIRYRFLMEIRHCDGFENIVFVPLSLKRTILTAWKGPKRGPLLS